MNWKEQELDRLHRQELEEQARQVRQANEQQATSNEAETPHTNALLAVVVAWLHTARLRLRDTRHAQDMHDTIKVPTVSGAAG